MEKIAHKLIQSYIQEKYFISTAYRRSSVRVASPPWYYETIAWKLDEETGENDKMISMANSGGSPTIALKGHFRICKELLQEEKK